MTLAVRPPEYFPRLPVAALLLVSDVVVLGDTFAYSRQSAQNRARIRTASDDGAMWLTVPVGTRAVGRAIPEVEIASDSRWERVHAKGLRHHYGSSPFFIHYATEALGMINRPPPHLAGLTVSTTRWLAEAIGAPARLIEASSLEGGPVSLSDVLETLRPERLIALDESFHAEQEIAARHGIESVRLDFRERPRRQNFPGFVPDCSCLDLVFNHGPEAAAYLRSCIGA